MKVNNITLGTIIVVGLSMLAGAFLHAQIFGEGLNALYHALHLVQMKVDYPTIRYAEIFFQGPLLLALKIFGTSLDPKTYLVIFELSYPILFMGLVFRNWQQIKRRKLNDLEVPFVASLIAGALPAWMYSFGCMFLPQQIFWSLFISLSDSPVTSSSKEDLLKNLALALILVFTHETSVFYLLVLALFVLRKWGLRSIQARVLVPAFSIFSLVLCIQAYRVLEVPIFSFEFLGNPAKGEVIFVAWFTFATVLFWDLIPNANRFLENRKFTLTCVSMVLILSLLLPFQASAYTGYFHRLFVSPITCFLVLSLIFKPSRESVGQSRMIQTYLFSFAIIGCFLFLATAYKHFQQVKISSASPSLEESCSLVKYSSKEEGTLALQNGVPAINCHYLHLIFQNEWTPKQIKFCTIKNRTGYDPCIRMSLQQQLANPSYFVDIPERTIEVRPGQFDFSKIQK